MISKNTRAQRAFNLGQGAAIAEANGKDRARDRIESNFEALTRNVSAAELRLLSKQFCLGYDDKSPSLA